MSVTLNARTLHRCLKRVNVLFPRMSSLPVLDHVLLSTEGDCDFVMRRTDLSAQVMGRIPCNEVSGTLDPVCVPADMLRRVIAGHKGDVEIGADVDNGVELKIGSMRHVLYGRPVDEFPKYVDAGDMSVRYKHLIRTLRPVLVSMCPPCDSRVLLNAVLFDFNNVQVLSTDTHRLHMNSLHPREQPSEAWGGRHVVPGDVCQNLGSVLGVKDNDPVCITIGEKKQLVSFSAPNWEVLTRLIEGTYPNPGKVIEGVMQTPGHWIVDPCELTGALMGLSVIARGNSDGVEFVAKGQKLILTTRSPVFGESECEVDLLEAGGIGEGMRTKFSYRYLRDAMQPLLGSKQIRISLKGKQDQAFVTAPENRDYMAVVMPMQIAE